MSGDSNFDQSGYISRLCSHPGPFACRITPRRAEIASIINRNL